MAVSTIKNRIFFSFLRNSETFILAILPIGSLELDSEDIPLRDIPFDANVGRLTVGYTALYLPYIFGYLIFLGIPY